jgi:putative transposase
LNRLEKNSKIKASLLETKERRKSQTCRVFKVKIQESSLTKQQKEQLKMIFVEAKWLINDILSWSEKEENKPWNYKLQKTVQVKKDDKFETRALAFLSVAEQQAVLAEIISNIKTLSSLKKKGSKVGRLKFRSEVKAVNLKQAGATHKILSPKRIKVQGVAGKLIVNGLKQFYNSEYELANAKLLNTPNGYYVAFTLFVKKESKNIDFLPEIGIDMGCETSITVSDGTKINAQVEETVRLKKLQRKLSRQTKQFSKNTNNSLKTCVLIRKEYQNISSQKDDLANKIVAELLKHSAVYMQDENLKGWQKGGHGKKIQHSVLGRVKMKLVNHPRVCVLDRWVPTSKGCECGNFHKELKISDRTFVCPYCNHTEDRDIHAAKNMVRYGKNKSVKKKFIGQGLSEFTPMDIGPLLEDGFIHSKASLVKEVGRCHGIKSHPLSQLVQTPKHVPVQL